jgi:hypothetical protein
MGRAATVMHIDPRPAPWRLLPLASPGPWCCRHGCARLRRPWRDRLKRIALRPPNSDNAHDLNGVAGQIGGTLRVVGSLDIIIAQSDG